jgi:predicted nuclease with TOPRIM domain
LTVQPSLPYIGPGSKGELPMDIAAFARLEQKIDELLGRLEALKAENASLTSRLDEKEKEAAELDQLLKVQDGERNEVKARIEALVQKLESF